MLKTMGLLHAIGQWTLMFLFHVIFLRFCWCFGDFQKHWALRQPPHPRSGPGFRRRVLCSMKLPTEGTNHPAIQAMT